MSTDTVEINVGDVGARGAEAINQNESQKMALNVGPSHPTTHGVLRLMMDLDGDVIVTKADAVINWIRKHSVWPMPMGLACCAIELMASAASRYDISRFGMEVMRFSPRQSDCMIVAGTVTYKMAEVVRRIYDQMGDPKWVVAMGACASTGGMYRSYAVMQGVDNIVPVDVYVSGCPPRPEALLDAMMKLQDKIGNEASAKNLKSEPKEAIAS